MIEKREQYYTGKSSKINVRHVSLFTLNNNPHWSKRSPSDHTCSTVTIDRLTNDSPRWPVCVGEEAAAWKKKEKKKNEQRFRNEANARNDKILARMATRAQQAPCIPAGM